MELRLYQTEDGQNVMNKTLMNEIIIPIRLKQQTSYYDPVLPIQSLNQDLTAYNYAFIDVFNRYYFITDVEPYPNKIYNLHLKTDVIETYKDDIMTSQYMATNNAVYINTELLESDVTLDTHSTYILNTLGG